MPEEIPVCSTKILAKGAFAFFMKTRKFVIEKFVIDQPERRLVI
jgi:hypothetical protein